MLEHMYDPFDCSGDSEGDVMVDIPYSYKLIMVSSNKVEESEIGKIESEKE